eukprot:78203_1
MEGKPYQEATQALHIALEQLRPLDQFNVCVFDHKHLCYQPTLVPANKDKISECKSWMEKHEPQIHKSFQPPLEGKLKDNLSAHAKFVMMFFNGPSENGEHPNGTVLSDPLETALTQTEKSDLLPFIVIISDGAVRDELSVSRSEIVQEDRKMRTRIVTLGIQSNCNCNWYFLTQLA